MPENQIAKNIIEAGFLRIALQDLAAGAQYRAEHVVERIALFARPYAETQSVTDSRFPRYLQEPKVDIRAQLPIRMEVCADDAMDGVVVLSPVFPDLIYCPEGDGGALANNDYAVAQLLGFLQQVSSQ
jgi:hypothetical protein